jgi:hypothetical protein
MSHTKTKQMKEIEALLGERRKFEGWIAQLEAKRESTPEHVYARVHDDYATRLAAVQGKLAAETEAVGEIVATLAHALAAQDAAITAKSDERAEAELRATVGEYADEEWEQKRAAFDSAIAALGKERDDVARELAAMTSVLDEASATATAPLLPPRPVMPPVTPPVAEAPVVVAPVAPPVMEPIVEPMVEPIAEPIVEPAPVVTKVHHPVAPPLVEESSLPDAHEDVAGAPIPQSDPHFDAPAKGKGMKDELAFLQDVLGRHTPQGRPAGQSPVAASPALEMPADQARESGAFRASGTFAIPTPLSSEAVKSLKCGECGTLNYPTEWYCERCGGELAAF